MQRLTTILMAAVMMLTAASAGAADKPKGQQKAHRHTIMSCNVRITGLEADEIDGRRWSDRKQSCLKVITSRKPDIICFQEGIYESNDFFKKELKGYESFGFDGPEMDPWTEGYHLIGKNMIFWKKSRYELVSEGCYWLSETPTIGGSISWDSSRARHCNWVRLRDRKTGVVFRVLDVHLDHLIREAKAEQTKVVIQETGQYAEGFPQILCGDFNSGRKDPPYQLLTEAGWHDAYEDIHGKEETGSTAHSWKPERLSGPKTGRRIDFVYSRGEVRTIDAAIVKDAPGGIWPSDHFFMYAVFEL